jgi:Ulp1 family protease
LSKIGVVFNTDPSDSPGKHWVSMYIDLEHGSVDYFDSYGMAPLSVELKRFISSLDDQYYGMYGRRMTMNLNCLGDVCTSRVQHQRKNTECGVYSINFIVERLSGRSWYDIVTGNLVDDDSMSLNRDIYFR